MSSAATLGRCKWPENQGGTSTGNVETARPVGIHENKNTEELGGIGVSMLA